MKWNYIPTEQYIYYETDQIVEIFFLIKGLAGFVLPFKKNIVYIEVNQGDFFGELDFVIAADEKSMMVEEMIANLSKI